MTSANTSFCKRSAFDTRVIERVGDQLKALMMAMFSGFSSISSRLVSCLEASSCELDKIFLIYYETKYSVASLNRPLAPLSKVRGHVASLTDSKLYNQSHHAMIKPRASRK